MVEREYRGSIVTFISARPNRRAFFYLLPVIFTQLPDPSANIINIKRLFDQHVTAQGVLWQ